MCEPATLMAVVGMGAQAVGGTMKASAERREAGFQANLLDMQADVARSAASDARQRGAFSAGQVRMAGSQAISGQRTAAGASGVAVDSGVVQNLAADSRLLSELDALMLENNAAREAWGMEFEASRLEEQAGFTRRSGQARADATLLGTGLDAVSGLTGLAGRSAGKVPRYTSQGAADRIVSGAASARRRDR